MILINSIDTASFTLNGTRYVKNFVCLPAGQTHIQIVGAYDTKLQILANTHYNQISVDGNTYGSQALLINALANVIFSKSSSSATINQNNVGVFNTTIQYAFTTPSNTILVSEIVNKINLSYAYAVSEVMTPYFFQFVRPALQEGSDTPIQKKYIFLFTGGKGSYGLGQTPVASTQFKLMVESVLNPDDIVDDDSAIINYLGEIPDGDYISVANESNWDFFDTDYTYYFSYTTDSVLYYVVFVGEAGLYGVDNVLFTEDDFVDSTNSDALPYIPTLQEIINQGSTATTANNISLNTTGIGKLLYNGSEVLNTAKKAVANGVASLDGAGKIPVSQLPNAVMIYKGMWNLSTNTPTLSNGTGTAGWVYKVTGAQTPTNFNFGDGNIQLTNGDYVIYSDTGTWEKSDGSDAVTSVNGYQGVVDLTYTDVDAAPTVHIHSMSDVTGLSTALDSKANTNGSNATGTWPINIGGSAAVANLIRTTAGDGQFHWQDGVSAGVLPTWIWGGTNVTDYYVFSPASLSVGNAANAYSAENWQPTVVSDFNAPVGFKLLQGVHSASNFPESYGAGIQISNDNNPNYINQIAFGLGGTPYTRSKIAGGWGGWNTLAFDSNVLHAYGDEGKAGSLTLTSGALAVNSSSLDLGNKKIRGTSISAPSGAQRWIKLFTSSSENNLNARLECNMTSSNSVQAFNIDIKGAYYDSTVEGERPFIEVVTNTYLDRLLEVMVLKEPSTQFAVYIKVNSIDNDVDLYWSLDCIDNGVVTVNNSLTAPSTTTGSFVLPTVQYVRANNYGFVQSFNGNVGIGTSIPTTKLDVQGTGRFTNVLRSETALDIAGTSFIGFNSNTWTLNYDSGSSGLNFTKQGSTSGALFLKDNSNIGINTVNPLYKLDVNGDAHIKKELNFSDGNWALRYNTGTTSFNIYRSTGYEFTITNGGNIGIGISSPSAKLDVNGDAYIRGKVRVDDGTNSYHAATVGQLNSATADLANADGSNAYGSGWGIDISGNASTAGDAEKLGGYQYNDTESIDIDNFIVNYAGEMHPMSVSNAQIKLGVDAIRANLTVSIPATSANSYSSASGINVPGAQVGDFVQIVTNLSYNGGIIYHGHVTSSNTVTIHRFNGSSSGLSSGNIDMKIKLTR